MLVALGFKPVKAAALALVADTAPVAFGAIAIPITTLSQVSGLPKHDLSQMVGRQTPFLALIIPFVLVFITGGWRGIREAWPAALTAGGIFAAVQFAVSNYVSPELTDILAALSSAAAVLALLQVWTPRTAAVSRTRTDTRARPGRPAVAGGSATDVGLERKIAAEGGEPLRPRTVLAAFAPYLIIIAVLGIVSLHGIQAELDKVTKSFSWPGLDVLNAKGKAPTSETYKLNLLTAAGTWLLVSGVLSMLVMGIRPRRAVAIYARTLGQLKWAILTVCAVLALAYVMNFSGQTITLGMWAAGAGSIFAFISPLIGWFGTAVTGSDTSTNSLFGALQVTAAHRSGLSPTLLAASNSSGGVLAKMVSPQNLAIGAAAVGLAGREGDIFRRVIGWSVVLVLLMAGLVLLQSTSALSWMVP
jgi:lactate permease